MRWRATALDGTGSRRTLVREAESAAALARELRSEGLLVAGIEPDGDESPLPPKWHWGWLCPMTAFDVELGLRELASMLRSGVTLTAALATAADQAASLRASAVWRRVRKRVVSGTSFAEALAAQGRRFGEITVRLAEVGERSGELEHALTHAADELEARRNLRCAVINALAYPCLAVAMAVGVSAYLVMAVIPKIGEFLQSGGAELPPLTQSLLDVSDWINLNLTWMVGVIAASVSAWWLMRWWRPGRELEDAFLMRLPVAGGILRLSGTALFARAMQILTEAGVTLLDALATAGALMPNRRLRRRVAEAREKVLRGGTLAEALAGAKEFLPMLRRMAAVGETTGALPESFGETARFHEMLLALAVKRLGMLIEPVMIVITGSIVGFVYIAFFMAMFALASVG